PNPSPLFVSMLFFWLFSWEIGGQNVPNDWADIEEDRRLHVQTIPVRLGPDRANAVIFGSLLITLMLSIVVFYVSPIPFEFPFAVAFMATGLCFLILPAAILYTTKAARYAMALFNMASYYPLALFVIVVSKLSVG
ncbi:MAG: UbiA family prenyltransferase, partial [Deltaproteobacteria bacterium]|nr:UbiA family prenyltransferase [Deltaproteobacteria bacterium]